MSEALFSAVFLPVHRGWPARLGSIAIHALLVTLIPPAVQLLTPVPDFQWNRYEVKPIHVRVPLYFTQVAASAPRRTRAVRAQPRREAASVGSAGLTRPRLELPPVPSRKNAQTVLLQPNVPMPNVRVSDLPALAFWARQPQAVAPPPLKPFVTPGRVEEPAPPPELDAPPMLAVPNRQTRLSELNVAALPAVRDPALPVPPSSTAPVRMPKVFKPPQAQQTGSIEAGQGDPANIIAFGVLPAPEKIITVPPVTQAPAFGGDGRPRLDSPAAKNGTSGDGHAANPHLNSAAKGSDAGHASGGGASAESSMAPRATVEPRQAAVRPAGDGAGGSGLQSNHAVQQAIMADARNAAKRPVDSSSAVRISQPRDGRFSFVVTGSSESYPEARGVLGGKVVYTVSVRVGAPKAWILQYCLPAAVERGLGLRASSVPLEAPYPFVMVRPAIASEIDVRRLIIHGFVTPAGRFEQLSMIGDVEFPEKQALLASLAQWEFRPASRDGQTTAVEVLLIIPREAV